jgi:hypothetical protein
MVKHSGIAVKVHGTDGLRRMLGPSSIHRGTDVAGALAEGVNLVRIVVVVNGNGELLQVVFALRSAGCLPSLLHGRQEQGNEDRDDCDHHKQFD